MANPSKRNVTSMYSIQKVKALSEALISTKMTYSAYTGKRQVTKLAFETNLEETYLNLFNNPVLASCCSFITQNVENERLHLAYTMCFVGKRIKDAAQLLIVALHSIKELGKAVLTHYIDTTTFCIGICW